MLSINPEATNPSNNKKIKISNKIHISHAKYLLLIISGFAVQGAVIPRNTEASLRRHRASDGLVMK